MSSSPPPTPPTKRKAASTRAVGGASSGTGSRPSAGARSGGGGGGGGGASAHDAASKKPAKFADGLTKALAAVAKQKEQFSASVAKLDELNATCFGDLATALADKEADLERLEQEFENQKRQRRLQMEMDLQEFGLGNCQAFLTSQGKTIVDKTEYEQLKADHAQLSRSHDSDVKAAVEAESRRHAASLAALRETMELHKRAEVATVEAKFAAQLEQIAMLKERIADLMNEVSQQRQLTKDVATSTSVAAQSGKQYYHHQSGPPGKQ